jgi:hypothetical protein
VAFNTVSLTIVQAQKGLVSLKLRLKNDLAPSFRLPKPLQVALTSIIASQFNIVQYRTGATHFGWRFRPTIHRAVV